MKMKNLTALIAAYYSLGVGAPLPGLGSSVQVNGNTVEAGSMIGLLAQMNTASSQEGQANFATSAGATATLTSLQNLLQRFTNGGAVTVTIDAAYNIVGLIANPFVGQTWWMDIITNAGTTIATPTLTGSSVTLSGTTTVLAAAWRRYQCAITQLLTTTGAGMTAGTTFTSIVQIGTTNRYTVTLATNAIVPVVGTAVFLNVTAGTLPSGWYPIDLVTSATSFVIVAPPASTAWTATAATLPGTTTVPVSQYTPGLLGIFSPLMTITGCMATVTATMSV